MFICLKLTWKCHLVKIIQLYFGINFSKLDTRLGLNLSAQKVDLAGRVQIVILFGTLNFPLIALEKYLNFSPKTYLHKLGSGLSCQSRIRRILDRKPAWRGTCSLSPLGLEEHISETYALYVLSNSPNDLRGSWWWINLNCIENTRHSIVSSRMSS